MKLEIAASRSGELLKQLLPVWEGSVRATHDFLTEKAIQGLKPVVRQALEGIERLVICRNQEGDAVAFLGVEGPKLEMLFVAAEARGAGIGGRLLQYAVRELGVKSVDVNEQNPRALGFYERFGFRVAGRSPLDGQGNPYPILHLEYGGVFVRPARPGDASLVCWLHMRLYGEQYGFHGVFECYVMKAMAAFLENPDGGRLWVALEGEKVIGSVAIVREDGEKAVLRWFVVDDGCQGRGIGRMLLDTALAFAREQGCRSVSLWTIRILEAARHLYEQAGFVLREEKPNREWAGRELMEERWELILRQL